MPEVLPFLPVIVFLGACVIQHTVSCCSEAKERRKEVSPLCCCSSASSLSAQVVAMLTYCSSRCIGLDGVAAKGSRGRGGCFQCLPIHHLWLALILLLLWLFALCSLLLVLSSLVCPAPLHSTLFYSVPLCYCYLVDSKQLKILIVLMYISTIILPVVLYGCETWSLTVREEHRLRVF
jgi:hypothetical protein